MAGWKTRSPYCWFTSTRNTLAIRLLVAASMTMISLPSGACRAAAKADGPRRHRPSDRPGLAPDGFPRLPASWPRRRARRHCSTMGPLRRRCGAAAIACGASGQQYEEETAANHVFLGSLVVFLDSLGLVWSVLTHAPIHSLTLAMQLHHTPSRPDHHLCFMPRLAVGRDPEC